MTFKVVNIIAKRSPGKLKVGSLLLALSCRATLRISSPLLGVKQTAPSRDRRGSF